jgi:signal transduction histidine kinase
VDIRRLVEGLRPPAIDELGLAAALTHAITRLTASSRTHVEVDIDEPLPAVPAAVEVALYRIVSEAVTNVVKHAGADTCSVSIGVHDGSVVATVHDDGHFAGVSSNGNGLSTMAERAEELGGTVNMTIVAGTKVVVTLPAGRPT